MKNGAGSGGKWLDIPPPRFPGFLARFGVRHGAAGAAAADADGIDGTFGDEGAGSALAALTVAWHAGHVTFSAPDGSAADCYPPFPESAPFPGSPPSLAPAPAESARAGGAAAGGAGSAGVAAAIAAHASAPRTVGVLLVRLGGYAAGVFAGYPPALADSKVGSRQVHGRSAAGGWSQHRFARRREKQASEALGAAADAAAGVFGRWSTQATARSGRAAAASGTATAGHRGTLDAVVLGGDRRAVAELRADPRLAPYFAIATDRFLTVPDPRRAVLEASPGLFTAVRIWLTETAG